MHVIEDKKTIQLLMEPTRAKIVFDYLVKDAMTVKQLEERILERFCITYRS